MQDPFIDDVLDYLQKTATPPLTTPQALQALLTYAVSMDDDWRADKARMEHKAQLQDMQRGRQLIDTATATLTPREVSA